MSNTEDDAKPLLPLITGGILVLLNLPSQSSVSLDGTVRHTQRDDFLGMVGLSSNLFHLVSVRPSTIEPKPGLSSGAPPHAMGLVVLHEAEGGEEYGRWMIARRYDPQTEELSREDAESMCPNLADAVYSGQVPRHRICTYDEFIEQSSDDVSSTIETSWKHKISHVSPSLLKRRGIKDGDKIVPGSFRGDDENDDSVLQKTSQAQQDGVNLSYPPIPCIDGRTSVSKHAGTKKFLGNLSPQERTALLHFHKVSPSSSSIVSSSVGNAVLDSVMETYYGGNDNWPDVIGDIQLSFVLFLNLGCLASFEHWRDLISMLSLAGVEQLNARPNLYSTLLSVVTLQIRSIEKDFFEEVEYSAGNFFTPAIQRLYEICYQSKDEFIRKNLQGLVAIMKTRFRLNLAAGTAGNDELITKGSNLDNGDEYAKSSDNEDNYGAMDLNNTSISHSVAQSMSSSDDDEDGPVIVPMDEFEDSLARSVAEVSHQNLPRSKEHVKKYPLLFASMTSQEDEVMACARILNACSDVSLVREAAAYLQEVESTGSTPVQAKEGKIGTMKD